MKHVSYLQGARWIAIPISDRPGRTSPLHSSEHRACASLMDSYMGDGSQSVAGKRIVA